MALSYRSSPPPAVLIEPTHRRIRLRKNGALVADTVRAIVVYENGGHPVYYLPKTDFAEGALAPSVRHEPAPLFGERRYFDLAGVGPETAWSHDGAAIGVSELGDYVTVDWNAVSWFEEDEEIFRHPRNVHKRVDTIASSRPVEVHVGGRLVARSRRAIFLFETGLRTRYYFPREDIVAGELAESTLQSYCPYKGTASYFHLDLDGKRHENIVWSYLAPLPESSRIAGLVAFYDEKVDDVRVGGKDDSP